MATLAADLARSRDVAAPIPLLPPVIRAVSPASGPDMLLRCFEMRGSFVKHSIELDRAGI